jgi:hypothetical protein
MQIADLACTVPDSRVLMERSGDIFDMISNKVEYVNLAGEWNQFEIIANNGHLQLFQDGHQVIDTQLSDGGEALVSEHQDQEALNALRQPRPSRR